MLLWSNMVQRHISPQCRSEKWSQQLPKSVFPVVCPTDCTHTSLTLQPAFDATCTDDGYKAYYKCSCDKYFEDISASVEITDLAAWKVGAGKIVAQGHSWSNGICTICGEIKDPDADYLPGDINGDGSVNNKDATQLFQYLSDWDVEVVEAALDVNGDGSVNNKDATRLFQYLSDWDVEIF